MKNKTLFIAIAAALLVTPLIAGAATSTGALSPQDLKVGNIPRASVVKEIKEKVASTTAAIKKAVAGAIARCPVVESKIQIKSSNFDNNKVRHLQAYQNLSDKLSAMADRLAQRNVDVAKLKADIAVLDQKIAKFSDDYAVYIGKLKDTQSYACGKTAGQFKTKLKESHAALKVVNQDAQDIRSYYNTTIKADIAALRAQIKSEAAISSSSPAAPQAAMPKLETATTTE